MEKQRDGLRERHTKRHDRGRNERNRDKERCADRRMKRQIQV
jgi:hypothetical protein